MEKNPLTVAYVDGIRFGLETAAKLVDPTGDEDTALRLVKQNLAEHIRKLVDDIDQLDASDALTATRS